MGHGGKGSPHEKAMHHHHHQQHSMEPMPNGELACSQSGVTWACLHGSSKKQGSAVQGLSRQPGTRYHATTLPHLTGLLSFFAMLLLQPTLVTSHQPPPGIPGPSGLNDDYQPVASTPSTSGGSTLLLAADYTAPAPVSSPYGSPYALSPVAYPAPSQSASPSAAAAPYSAPSPAPYFSPQPAAVSSGLPTLYLTSPTTPSPLQTVYTTAATGATAPPAPPYSSPAPSPVPSPAVYASPIPSSSPPPSYNSPAPSPVPSPLSPNVSPSPFLYLPSPSPSPPRSPYVAPPSPSPPYCATPQFSSNLTSHCSTAFDTKSCMLSVSCVPWCSGGQVSLTQLNVNSCNMGYVTAVCNGTVTCGTSPPPYPSSYYSPSPPSYVSPSPSPSPAYSPPYYYSPSMYSPSMLSIPPGWTASLQCGVSGMATLQYDNIRASISSVLSIDVSQVMVARSSEVVTVLYRVTDNIYVGRPYGYASTACNSTLLTAMSGALCSQLGLPDCGMVSTSCWYGSRSQTAFPAWPPSAWQPLTSGCATYVVATVKLQAGVNSAQLALSLYQTTLQLPGYQVQVPGTGDMAASPILNFTLIASAYNQLSLSTATIEQRTSVLLGLQVTCYASAAILFRLAPSLSPTPSPPSPNTSPYQSPASPSTNSCPKPHLGALCGRDATGAIVGIAVGAFVILALLLVTLYFMFRKGRRTSVVCDEFHWAANHQYIQNSCPAAYHPGVVRGTPYAVQCPGQSPVHASYQQ